MGLSSRAQKALETGLASTALSEELQNIAAADVASFSGQVAGMTTNVTIEADVAGSAGNITLTQNGSDIDTLISAHNGANPTNTVTLVTGDGTQVPTANITLSGGAGVATAASDKLKKALEVGLASTAMRDEVVAAAEAGSTILSDKAKRHIKIMMANNSDGQELIDEIEQ